MKRTFSIAALTAVLFTGLIASAQAAPAHAHQAKPVAQQKAHAPAVHTKKMVQKKMVQKKMVQKKVVQKKVMQKKAHASAHKKAHRQQAAKNARHTFSHWTPRLKAQKYHGFGTARYYDGNYHVSAYNQRGVPIKLLVNAITGVIIHANAHH
ncbi:MAG: hypothetical protein ACJAXQ_001240 [Parvibaculaceae bacterium]|jgi:hypothetical protein|tara:strand:+ start:546 stop:1001 length:456 start_codon:yes stop_codon:yes gene_type:complete